MRTIFVVASAFVVVGVTSFFASTSVVFDCLKLALVWASASEFVFVRKVMESKCCWWGGLAFVASLVLCLLLIEHFHLLYYLKEGIAVWVLVLVCSLEGRNDEPELSA